MIMNTVTGYVLSIAAIMLLTYTILKYNDRNSRGGFSG